MRGRDGLELLAERKRRKLSLLLGVWLLVWITLWTDGGQPALGGGDRGWLAVEVSK